MPVGGGVCGGDDEEDEDDDPPDARRADHVDGTSRPSGETHPMPVTTTLRRGGASAWAGMPVLMVRARNGRLTVCSVCSAAVLWRFLGGLREARQARSQYNSLSLFFDGDQTATCRQRTISSGGVGLKVRSNAKERSKDSVHSCTSMISKA